VLMGVGWMDGWMKWTDDSMGWMGWLNRRIEGWLAWMDE
jgi:hypothetical protein